MGRPNRRKQVDNGMVSVETSWRPSPSELKDTTGSVELRDLLDDIQEATQQGHALLKDLRIESRRARQVLPMIVSKRIQSEVEKQLAEMGEQTKVAMDQAVAKVFSEFDRLFDLLMGQDHQARREGKQSIPDLIEKLASNPVGVDDAADR